jgi:hypothetical protein
MISDIIFSMMGISMIALIWSVIYLIYKWIENGLK